LKVQYRRIYIIFNLRINKITIHFASTQHSLVYSEQHKYQKKSKQNRRMQVSKAYIVAGLRTAGGRRGGRLSGWHSADLGAAVLNGLMGRVNMDPALIEDVIFGCVGQVCNHVYACILYCIVYCIYLLLLL
jgi:hypothetical protein